MHDASCRPLYSALSGLCIVVSVLILYLLAATTHCVVPLSSSHYHSVYLLSFCYKVLSATIIQIIMPRVEVKSLPRGNSTWRFVSRSLSLYVQAKQGEHRAIISCEIMSEIILRCTSPHDFISRVLFDKVYLLSSLRVN